MRTTILLLLILAFLVTCKVQKYPWTHNTFSGVLVGCDIDSTSWFTEHTIRISSSKSKINLNCQNKPDFYMTTPVQWPIDVSLKFKEKIFLYGYNPRKVENGIGVSVDGGKLHYNKSEKILTLTSDKFHWTKSFKLQYNNLDSVLVLTE